MSRYRIGRRNGHTIYWQHGDEPSDTDRFVGSTVCPEFATEIVRDANKGIRADSLTNGQEQER